MLLPIKLINLITSLFRLVFVLIRLAAFRNSQEGMPFISRLEDEMRRAYLPLPLLPDINFHKFIDGLRRRPRLQRFFDNRPKILYLRPFKMDQQKVHSFLQD